jgi:hypothetical protein
VLSGVVRRGPVLTGVNGRLVGMAGEVDAAHRGVVGSQLTAGEVSSRCPPASWASRERGAAASPGEEAVGLGWCCVSA